MDLLRGKTVRWTFADGPVAGMRFEHTFHDDGGVTWRILEGQGKGHSSREKQCATMQVTDDVCTASYLGASGHTLTVVLDFSTGRMFAFASSNSDWHALTGVFEVVQGNERA
jgi:MoaF N-terminal domain